MSESFGDPGWSDLDGSSSGGGVRGLFGGDGGRGGRGGGSVEEEGCGGGRRGRPRESIRTRMANKKLKALT